MAVTRDLQMQYSCDRCKNASDEHGRGCKINILTPALLVMKGFTKCPFYEIKKKEVQI